MKASSTTLKFGKNKNILKRSWATVCSTYVAQKLTVVNE